MCFVRLGEKFFILATKTMIDLLLTLKLGPCILSSFFEKSGQIREILKGHFLTMKACNLRRVTYLAEFLADFDGF